VVNGIHRLSSDTGVNRMSGTPAVPPASPWCEILDSHRPARVVSPGSGNEWVNVHRSTLRYAEPPHTLVVTDASRLVVQKLGATV
jgi:hypothetical protein